MIDNLTKKWKNVKEPFMVHPKGRLYFNDILNSNKIDLSQISKGSVVALIGDFNPISISTLIKLFEKKAIVVPLTQDTKQQHEYFFETAFVDFIIEDKSIIKRSHKKKHLLIEKLRDKGSPGLVLFSTGTTGLPKAILHDFSLFLKRYETPRPTLTTLSFLLFDHIGGINTLFHTLYNNGVIITPSDRKVETILTSCKDNSVEVLPTTPTFLRMMLFSGHVPSKVPESLKIITYGTERMDKHTLSELCRLLPNIDFRQTYGMSELGIVRVKSEKRNSLFMKIGGEGIQTKVLNNTLHILSENRMLGYLNDKSPFDKEGWYNTNDIVEVKEDFLKITGRTTEIINVAGLKFMSSDVENICLKYEQIKFVKVITKDNPITGQHVEVKVQPSINSDFSLKDFKTFLSKNLQKHMIPKRIIIDNVAIMHRFKKS